MLKKKVYFLTTETEFLKSILSDSTIKAANFNQVESFNNDFLMESLVENSLIDLLRISQENLTSFKINLLETSFYDSKDVNIVTFKETLSYNLNKMGDNIITGIYLNSMGNYETLSFVEQNLYIPYVLGDIEYGSLEKKLERPVLLLSGNNSDSYLFSIFNIINTNNFLLESYNFNNMDDLLMVNFNFAISGMIIIILALFFKLALAPFHLWSPDVYEGSPSSSTFFFMAISKFSILVFLFRICYFSFYSFICYWQFYSLIIATISIFIGAVAGLKQRRLKSLLTYSSINNMGFVLLAFSIGNFEGIQVKFYYLIVYMISSLCIWSLILNFKIKKKNYSEKQNRDLGDLALLQESNNIIAQNLAVTLFTLAGLPPMVGFLAKMGVFKALTGVSIYFFSIVNILFSVVATFYYLRIVKIIFFENILIGNLYTTINTKKTFLINLLTFFLIFFFMSPMFLYLYSYKITLLLNKTFY